VLTAFLVVGAGCAGFLENSERFSDGGTAAFVCPSLGQPAKAQLIAQKCVSGCHSAAIVEGGLDLESPGAAARLVNVASVQCPPRDRVWSVDGGVLQEKIQLTSPTCGGSMPPGGGLTNSEVSCIVEWTRYLVDGGTE
jgi:hypothetical protein